MLNVLILVCSMSTSQADCDKNNAIDVMTAGRAGTPQQCGFRAQAMLAETSVAPEPGKQYMKVMCVRERLKEAGR